MSDILPLAVFPNKPIGNDLELIKQAKALLDTTIKIQVCRAVPGSPGRILALRESPNFLCDHALVRNPTLSSVQAALAYCLGLTEDTRGMTVLKMLKETFGEETTEIATNID
jgi:hypothetical protein